MSEKLTNDYVRIDEHYRVCLLPQKENGFVGSIAEEQEQAEALHSLPPPYGETEYMYLPLICATNDFANGAAAHERGGQRCTS